LALVAGALANPELVRDRGPKQAAPGATPLHGEVHDDATRAQSSSQRTLEARAWDRAAQAIAKAVVDRRRLTLDMVQAPRQRPVAKPHGKLPLPAPCPSFSNCTVISNHARQAARRWQRSLASSRHERGCQLWRPF
jgi:hypothetical protein